MIEEKKMLQEQRKQKQLEQEEDLQELADDARLVRKLKRGKVSGCVWVCECVRVCVGVRVCGCVIILESNIFY